jgi:transcriptional regulator with XRE-family HTH domain
VAEMKNITLDAIKIGERIKEARTCCRMLQTEFVEELSVKVDTLSRWERGKTVPKTSELMELFRVYGISVEWLLEQKGTVLFIATNALEAVEDENRKATLGERLEEVQKRSGLSRKEFGERIGLTGKSISPTLSGWFHNKRVPTPEQLVAIKHEFQISLDVLLYEGIDCE